MTNKYAEGYPGKRYYGGCQFVDVAETLAIERAKQLFGCEFANVQPNSGSQMNQAVFLALLQPRRHLHGPGPLKFRRAPDPRLARQHVGQVVSMSCPMVFGATTTCSTWKRSKRPLAQEHKPKLHHSPAAPPIRASGTGRRFPPPPGEIADSVGAWLMVDMAHIAGLVAGGAHAVAHCRYAHVVTSTTHKSLRGPRGGPLILTNDPDLAKKLNSAVFPGLQGGPLMHVIAARAVAFGEALAT